MDVFMQNYYTALRTPPGNNPVRDRSDGFKLMFEELLKLGRPTRIIETGTMRPDHGWEFGNDGLSTYLFDQFSLYTNGGLECVISIDINKENCEFSASKTSNRTLVICDNSVHALFNISGTVDLLYLDSYDFEFSNPEPSWMHCLKELCAARHLLVPGSLVAVDDHFVGSGMVGKGYYVQKFLEEVGATKLHEGYQIVYRI